MGGQSFCSCAISGSSSQTTSGSSQLTTLFSSQKLIITPPPVLTLLNYFQPIYFANVLTSADSSFLPRVYAACICFKGNYYFCRWLSSSSVSAVSMFSMLNTPKLIPKLQLNIFLFRINFRRHSF